MWPWRLLSLPISDVGRQIAECLQKNARLNKIRYLLVCFITTELAVSPDCANTAQGCTAIGNSGLTVVVSSRC